MNRIDLHAVSQEQATRFQGCHLIGLICEVAWEMELAVERTTNNRK